MRFLPSLRHVAALPRTQAPLHRTSFGLQIGKKESPLEAAVFEIGCLYFCQCLKSTTHEGYHVFHHCRLLIAVMLRIRISCLIQIGIYYR
jgi:hypothetical protein